MSNPNHWGRFFVGLCVVLGVFVFLGILLMIAQEATERPGEVLFALGAGITLAVSSYIAGYAIERMIGEWA